MKTVTIFFILNLYIGCNILYAMIELELLDALLNNNHSKIEILLTNIEHINFCFRNLNVPEFEITMQDLSSITQNVKDKLNWPHEISYGALIEAAIDMNNFNFLRYVGSSLGKKYPEIIGNMFNYSLIKKRFEIVYELISYQFNVNVRDMYGKPILINALSLYNTDPQVYFSLVNSLLDNGANPLISDTSSISGFNVFNLIAITGTLISQEDSFYLFKKMIKKMYVYNSSAELASFFSSNDIRQQRGGHVMPSTKEIIESYYIQLNTELLEDKTYQAKIKEVLFLLQCTSYPWDINDLKELLKTEDSERTIPEALRARELGIKKIPRLK